MYPNQHESIICFDNRTTDTKGFELSREPPPFEAADPPSNGASKREAKPGAGVGGGCKSIVQRVSRNLSETDESPGGGEEDDVIVEITEDPKIE